MSAKPTQKEQRLAQMRKELGENERIIRIKIQNDCSMPLGIEVEPLGMGDEIPPNTTWEYIGIITISENEDLTIQLNDKTWLTIWDEARGRFFNENDAGTMIDF